MLCGTAFCGIRDQEQTIEEWGAPWHTESPEQLIAMPAATIKRVMAD